jgi:ubiquinone/menaquinone biosynthesis C-methylase UbiE
MSPEEHEIMRSVEDHYWWYRALRWHVTDAIDSQFAAGKLLDAGCGTGGMLHTVRERFPRMQLTGIDASSRALDLTRERKIDVQLIQSTVDELPFADQAFDCVLSIDVVTAATVDANRAMAEMRRVLRPGGQLILNVAALRFLRGAHDAATNVTKRFTRAELAQLISAAGLMLERMTYWNALLMPPVAIARWLSRRRAKEQPRSDFRPLPNAANATLRNIALLELNVSRYVPLPFGTSLFAVARRNE